MSCAGVAALSPIRDGSLFSSNNFCNLSTLCLDESIFIYLSVSGSMTPMRVLESDTIESVKLKIQSYKGFFVKNQKLVCGGRELSRSNSLVRDYGVTDGNILHLVLKLSDLKVISVRTSCGKDFTFHVERGKDVGYVKKQIAKKEKGFADVTAQEVECNGERLEDERLIGDICAKHDAVIHFLVRKSAKVRARPVEKSFEISIVAAEVNSKRDYDAENYDGLRKFGAGVEDSANDVDEKIQRKPPDRGVLLQPVIVNPKVELCSDVLDMVNSTFEGLDRENHPIRSLEGTGGAYFMLDSSGTKYVSVFKPMDEEPMAVNNPRGLPLSMDGAGLKKGTVVGQGALREVAAYILDHPMRGHQSLFDDKKGFAGVPPTVLVKCLHKAFNHLGVLTAKIGSLQLFMENNGSCEDMGPGSFPVKEVQKISVLDIRLANADRHAGNILLSKDKDSGETVLIPIDHGYCLPSSFEDCTFEWLYWPQARQPYSPDIIDYIKSLDAEEDIALLKFHGWDLPLKCARTLRITTMLLKKAVERGFTPFAIGSIMCREAMNKESIIEEIVQEAEDSVLPGTSEALFLDAVSQIIDQRLEEIAGAFS